MITTQKINTEEHLQKAFEIRKIVFVQEQNVPENEEYDEFEKESNHFLAFFEQVPCATARWRFTEKGIKLERFAVLKAFRSKKIGSAILEAILQDINQNDEAKSKQLYLHAQLQAVNLYKKAGFEIVGEQFLECDIWHYKMVKQP